MLGIFDSGLGGLTALKELRRLTPGEELIYFGDTGRVPYGTKSEATIKKYALQDAAFLVSKGVSAILVACGTVSTTALSDLKSAFSIPIIGVVEPAAEAAVKATTNGKIGIIGTSATIRSGAFKKAISALDSKITTYSQDCPLFVPLVENGFSSPDCEITKLTCEHYLKGLKNSGIDTLILGCTHYPIIAETIGNYLPNVKLINTGAEAASRLVQIIGKKEGAADCSYFVSDDAKLFTTSASLFLGNDITGMVSSVNIESF
ncbi:MAG: glutamate racemase [Clostridia bacterium]|nr:glutamate racemase [Clostridia bacterium]